MDKMLGVMLDCSRNAVLKVETVKHYADIIKKIVERTEERKQLQRTEFHCKAQSLLYRFEMSLNRHTKKVDMFI